MFCQFCGGKHTSEDNKKVCPSCGKTTFANPIPVVVPIVPVWDEEARRYGVLVVERGIEPAIGGLALPGGFCEIEDWQTAGFRELEEETGVTFPEGTKFILLSVKSTKPNPNRILIFAETPQITLKHLDTIPTPETVETRKRLVLWENDDMTNIAFPLHAEEINSFFDDYCNSSKKNKF
jgi:ADP-ribose pyrophosphatase YjhB (NUDIX family)